MTALDTNTQVAGTTYQQLANADDEDELPPALLEAIHEDPAKMAPMARKFAAEVLFDMFQESPSYTPAQKRDFVDICARLGDLDPKKRADNAEVGSKFSVTINIPQQVGGPAIQPIIVEQVVQPVTVQYPEFEVVDDA